MQHSIQKCFLLISCACVIWYVGSHHEEQPLETDHTMNALKMVTSKPTPTLSLCKNGAVHNAGAFCWAMRSPMHPAASGTSSISATVAAPTLSCKSISQISSAVQLSANEVAGVAISEPDGAEAQQTSAISSLKMLDLAATPALQNWVVLMPHHLLARLHILPSKHTPWARLQVVQQACQLLHIAQGAVARQRPTLRLCHAIEFGKVLLCPSGVARCVRWRPAACCADCLSSITIILTVATALVAIISTPLLYY